MQKEKIKSIYITRIISIALFIAVIAGTLDVWWHGFMGRDSLWEPPHILLYAAILTAIGLGIYGYYSTREKSWKLIALSLLLVLISAPIDDIWHRIFGVENALSPIIIWSPPHLILVGAIIFSLSLLIKELKKDTAVAQYLFTSISFASILSLLLFVVSPFQPIGSYKIIGFYGSFFITLVFIGLLIISERTTKHTGVASLIALLFIAISAVSFGETADMKGFAPLHDHPPSWVNVFSFLAPAFLIDLTGKLPNWLRGTLAGFVFTIMLYGLSNIFFASEFQYTISNMWVAVVSGTIGGLISGYLLHKKVYMG